MALCGLDFVSAGPMIVIRFRPGRTPRCRKE
jgi:hypothetical protein